MSAIFGKYNFDGSPVSSATLLSMQKAMAYWGPDGDGTWCEDHVGVGNLRRNNTPESLGDALPWTCPASGDVITASVRLDNRDELFNALSIPRPDRAKMPDSRIILSAYHQWGEACTDRLLGDWVFAIWNAKARKLFVARDHHGNTGLYYYSDSRSFVFASSLKGLLTLPEVPRHPNPLTIAQLLVVMPAQRASTYYEGILHLPPAHAMTVTPKGIEVKRYWYLEHTPDLHLRTDEEYVEAFLEVFTEAVRCRLRCSAPVGVTLSGGLDSGSVAWLAARELAEHGQRLAAFSSVPANNTEGIFGGNRYRTGDETPFIEATAQSAGNIDVDYVDAREVSPVKGIERGLYINDQPGLGASNMYWMTALLAEGQKQGLGAMLTGQGGNATISWTGDPEPYLLEYLVKLQWATLGRKFRAWQEVTERSLWAAVRSQIVRPLLMPVRQGMRRFRGPADAWREHSPINVAFARELDLSHLMAQQGHDPTFSRPPDYSKVRMDFLILPGRSSIGNLWCELGAAYGLEVRDPTNDPRVMSFCCSIPNNQHVRDYRDRLLIRRAMAGCLPERVLWNRRRGVQAADVAQRLIHHRSELEAALASLERSELARHYLDLPKMRTVFESVQHRIDPKNIGQCFKVLLRGLMVGLFLLQFDT